MSAGVGAVKKVTLRNIPPPPVKALNLGPLKDQTYPLFGRLSYLPSLFFLFFFATGIVL